jgi:hypothetical protein
MLEAHLNEEDVVRLLSPTRVEGDGLMDLEQHASTCATCADRLSAEAALEVALIDAGDARVQRRRLARRRVGVGAMALLAAAAAVVVAFHGAPTVERMSADPYVASAPDAPARDTLDDAWGLAGSRPDRYTKSVETERSRSSPVRVLASTGEGPINGFGTLMQMFSAEKYRGKRIRFSADVRVDNVTQSAGLWMRVDTPERKAAAFDNMSNRPITGTKSWSRYEVVLDVGDGASKIALGILMSGTGSARLSDPRVEVVGSDVPVTSSSHALAPDFRP